MSFILYPPVKLARTGVYTYRCRHIDIRAQPRRGAASRRAPERITGCACMLWRSTHDARLERGNTRASRSALRERWSIPKVLPHKGRAVEGAERSMTRTGDATWRPSWGGRTAGGHLVLGRLLDARGLSNLGLHRARADHRDGDARRQLGAQSAKVALQRVLRGRSLCSPSPNLSCEARGHYNLTIGRHAVALQRARARLQRKS